MPLVKEKKDMKEISALLPPVLQHDFIARLDGKKLLIGRRDRFPFEKTYFTSSCAEDTATAIRNMVTQGGGPLEAALWTLVLEARLHGKDLCRIDYAIRVLSEARKTNATMKFELEALKNRFSSLPEECFADALEELVRARLDDYDRKYLSMGQQGNRLIREGDGILTTCFPEHSFFLSLALARSEGKSFTVFAPETRPYLQGARLTAPSLASMDYSHFLITDNMCAFFMREKRISLYMTACDKTTRAGWVVNKTGTLANAICARYFSIPYYAFALSYDERYGTLEKLDVEWRDSCEVSSIRGVMTTSQEVKTLYPAFDIIAPELVSGIILPEEEKQ